MARTDQIQMAHGGGGQLMAELIEQTILPALGGVGGGLTDSALLEGISGTLAFTTDSYVVKPLEFPGGDIGKLSICGTVNDLAVCGDLIKALSMGLVLSEGLDIALLRRVLESAGRCAAACGVRIVTGDTKVVEHGSLDGMVINTSGVGVVDDRASLGFDRVSAGDRVVLSGPLGEHALAVMSLREGLSFSADLDSDCASLNELTGALVAELGQALRFMRDPTRGGLAATLVEVAAGTGRDIEIEESAVPINRTALAAAEMLGLDLMSAANEGKLVALVAHEAAEEAVAILSRFEIGSRAAVIGTVGQPGEPALVEMLTAVGGRRVVQMPYGEELPRIC